MGASPPAVCRLNVPWQGDSRPVSLAHHPVAAGVTLPAWLVLAHGAGGTRESPFMVALAAALVATGVGVTLFNFPYSEAGRRMPDREPLLLATWDAVVRAVQAETPPGTTLVCGGKSMGGRMAGLAAARGLPAQGVVYLGFPLCPPRKRGAAGAADDPCAARIAPLVGVPVPQLFVQGSRDPFGSGDDLRPHLARMRNARLHTVSGGDHSLERPGHDGVPLADTLADVAQSVVRWLREDVPGTRA